MVISNSNQIGIIKINKELDMQEQYNYDKLKFPPTKQVKKQIVETIKFGKVIPARPKFNEPPKEMAHYLHNFVVYTDIKNREVITRCYLNTKSGEPTLDRNVKFKNSGHVNQRKLGRLISMSDIFKCLAYGMRVPDYKVNAKTGWKHWDNYYLYNDLVVIASRKTEYYEIETAYRTTHVMDNGFTEVLPDLVDGLKKEEDSFSRVCIINRTAAAAFEKTDEHVQMKLMACIANGEHPKPGSSLVEQAAHIGMANLLTKEKMELIRSDPEFNFHLQTRFAAAVAKHIELGGMPHAYPWGTQHNATALPLEDFIALPHNEYSLVFKFEGSAQKKLHRKQRHLLKLYGLDMDRYPYNLEWKTIESKNLAILAFDMNLFSANDQPWSHRRNNGTQ